MTTTTTTQEFVQITDERFRLGYHVAAANGWINDPNGFCYFKGYYHIFYQHHPYSENWGPMHWGHARSRDLIHWETLPIALAPDTEGIDEGGCFSGSAIVKDDKLYLVYTGHHYYGDGDPEHFWENQNVAVSEDGIKFEKIAQNPVISSAPEDSTHHFRDPKVWQEGEDFYMVLGNQNKEGLGRVIIYKSQDLIDWTYLTDISYAESVEKEGFMWECPDFFTIDGKDILLTSPQGIKAQDEKYRNLFQTGYFVGKMDENHKFNRGEFKELDFGHDFYATQTALAPDGRRLVFAWMAMWESDMPEKADGWAGALTFPRELSLHGDRLFMKPVREIKDLRTEELVKASINSTEVNLLEGQTNTAEIRADFKTEGSFELNLQDEQANVLMNLAYDQANGKFTLKRADREGDDRFANLEVNKNEYDLHILVDTSSVEIFINSGEIVFTERFYIEGKPTISLKAATEMLGEYVTYQLDNKAIDYNIK
ncbi:sucrose-6-phosphate hydrolase [Streptococcaceae bacterium ESL0729]|nr:sucrose-6-phosphate hydrolase [Streptococcaceae bacterium ESL0729]